ncbi:hypothetical protein MHTCC0001_23420 [Flavobacteriaceae bacterium MHTCC 0001]
MGVFKQLFNFYINSSIHVGLSVYALTYLTLLELDMPYDEVVLYFVFFATITGYNFVKYFGLAKFHHRSLTRWLRAIQIFSFFCFVFMCYYAFYLPLTILFFLGIFGMITFFYAIPFLPRRIFIDKQNNLRSIAGLKVYVIALVWAGVTVFLPILKNDMSVSGDVMVLGIQRFALVVLLMLPFEIRDLKFDSLKLSTIPQQIGIHRTKLLAFVLGVLIFLLEFFKDNVSVFYTLCLFVILILCVVMVIFAKKEQHQFYSAFWVEGIPFYWLVLVLVFR